MAARQGALPLESLVKNSSAVRSAGTAANANGHWIGVAASGNSPAGSVPMGRLVLMVTNGDTASHTVTVRAGGSGVTPSGGNAVPVPYTEATTGDLNVVVANATTAWIGPFESDRFLQSDGNIYIDYTGVTSVTVWALMLPYNQV
jgi:hypothetical protein